MTSWAEALDAYEAGLEHHRHLVEHDELDGSNPWPPAELPKGPVPEALRERANNLLSEGHTLMDSMAGKMAGMPAPRPVRYGRHATPHQPRWTTRL